MKLGTYTLTKTTTGYFYEGSLDLSGTNITTLPDNLTVGGSLDLSGTNITTLPDNLTVGGWLDLSGTNITTLSDNLTVGNSLYLSGTNITTLPDNLTVGNSLDLRDTNITTLPDNLTVGNSLYLSGTNITTLPDNLTVGNSLYLSGTNITTLPDNVHNVSPVLSWQKGKYVKIDGLFAEVLSKKGKVWKLKRLNQTEVFYCVTDGMGKFAHGETIQAAKQDLIYKLSKDANIEQFKTLTLQSTLSFDKCIEFYRVVTGACEFGVKDFIKSHNVEQQDYTLAEILEKTKGQYGSEKLSQFVKSLNN